MTDEEMIEARKRAKEYREIAEEYCANGGLLLGEEITWRDVDRNRQR